MALAPLHWPVRLEGPLLVLLTFAASFGVYLAVRRVSWLRAAFGLQPAAARAAPPDGARLAKAQQPR
jgi:hypothetical protein